MDKKLKKRGGNNIRKDKPLYLKQLKKITEHPKFPLFYLPIVQERLEQAEESLKNTQIYSARVGKAVHWPFLIAMAEYLMIEIKIPASQVSIAQKLGVKYYIINF